MTAPAPQRSSTAGRSDPSGQRSPAGTTTTAGGRLRAATSCPAIHPATAARLRREAATTSAPAPASRWLIVDPFGDGSTRSLTPDASRIDLGDRLIGALSRASVSLPTRDAAALAAALAAARVCDRGTARVPPSDSASATAESSFQRQGWTAMPPSAATDTHVVKLSTSTTTAVTAAPDATAYRVRAWAPVGPHSRRTTCPSWLCHGGAAATPAARLTSGRRRRAAARGGRCSEAVGRVDELGHLVPRHACHRAGASEVEAQPAVGPEVGRLEEALVCEQRRSVRGVGQEDERTGIGLGVVVALDDCRRRRRRPSS